jgi:two-component system NtrC family sensor kinase
MKRILRVVWMVLLPFVVNAQQSTPASLRAILQKATTDSARHNACVELSLYYSEVNRDSALFYTTKRLILAKQNNQKLAEAFALGSLAYQYERLGNYAASFQKFLQALKIADDPNNQEVIGWRIAQFPIPGKGRLVILATIHHNLSILMFDAGNEEQQIFHLKEGLRIARQINHIDRQMNAYGLLSIAYLRINQLDSALYFAKEAYLFAKNPTYKGIYSGKLFGTIGYIYLEKGDKILAYKYYRKGLQLSTVQNNQNSIPRIKHILIQYFLKESVNDSALSIARKNLQAILFDGNVSDNEINIGVAYEDLYLAYQLKKQQDSAYKYQGLALVAKDSLYKIRIKNIADFQKLSLGEAMRLENLEKEKIQTQSKFRTYGMLAGLAILSIIGFILYRNNRQKQKANQVLETALSNLKSTQSQLIQSEKMASLGELTAGIAHEIQNPLNFVNNFSEVNTELIDEADHEIDKGNTAEAKAILKDIKDNEEKINHHGKRADAIVKGMLQHSRSSSGVREATDINALADEYLRLAYHGLRAKDKDFNATLVTDFDDSIGMIDMIPQDIGRVILNLITNAFYVVTSKKKILGDGYEPTVSVSTKRTGDKVIIKVRDNGMGIPPKVQEKIFQPFFTTKPTGEGTGLGLSMSYDMITKGHNGELTVETEEGEYAEFTIVLPI